MHGTTLASGLSQKMHLLRREVGLKISHYRFVLTNAAGNMSRVIRYMVCTVVLLLAGAVQALACTCSSVTPEGNFNISEAVFAGTVLHVAPDSSGKLSLVSFAVATVWKGNLTSEMLIGTEGGTCYYPFEVGKAYLVYAVRRDDASRGRG